MALRFLDWVNGDVHGDGDEGWIRTCSCHSVPRAVLQGDATADRTDALYGV